jgi:hypothetical protein
MKSAQWNKVYTALKILQRRLKNIFPARWSDKNKRKNGLSANKNLSIITSSSFQNNNSTI